jgi:CrcB protein
MVFSIQHLLAVGAGGAIGAIGRYTIMAAVGHWFGHGFPWGTLLVNVAGSFLLGAFVELSALVWSPSPELRAFLVIGLFGAFTTFSAFALDVQVLWVRGMILASLGYVLASVTFSVLGLFAGMRVLRMVLQ